MYFRTHLSIWLLQSAYTGHLLIRSITQDLIKPQRKTLNLLSMWARPSVAPKSSKFLTVTDGSCKLRRWLKLKQLVVRSFCPWSQVHMPSHSWTRQWNSQELSEASSATQTLSKKINEIVALATFRASFRRAAVSKTCIGPLKIIWHKQWRPRQTRPGFARTTSNWSTWLRQLCRKVTTNSPRSKTSIKSSSTKMETIAETRTLGLTEAWSRRISRR